MNDKASLESLTCREKEKFAVGFRCQHCGTVALVKGKDMKIEENSWTENSWMEAMFGFARCASSEWKASHLRQSKIFLMNNKTNPCATNQGYTGVRFTYQQCNPSRDMPCHLRHLHPQGTPLPCQRRSQECQRTDALRPDNNPSTSCS